ncbi:MAG: hypothetical protein ACAH59_08305 [Pseudobdellovibrionaceae bacterium]
MKSIFTISLFLTFSAGAAPMEAPMSSIRPSTEIEASCRIKAKEVAVETYRTCVTDEKNAQIEQIKKEYAEKLQNLKSHYEQELKKMNGTKAKASAEEIESTPVEKKSSGAQIKKGSAGKTAVVTSKRAGKKSKKAYADMTEMTVQLRPAPAAPPLPSDESTMDLPEPIPVENVPAESAI